MYNGNNMQYGYSNHPGFEDQQKLGTSSIDLASNHRLPRQNQFQHNPIDNRTIMEMNRVHNEVFIY